MKRVLLWLVSAGVLISQQLSASHGQSTPAAPQRNQMTIEESLPVRISKQITFWHFGKPLGSNDALLLRIHVGDQFEFSPRGIEPPQFVSGEYVGITVKSPFGDGTALVLVPVPAQGGSNLLWLAPPGVSPEGLKEALTLRLLKSAPRDGPRVSAPTSPSNPVSYRDLNELQVKSNPGGPGSKK